MNQKEFYINENTPLYNIRIIRNHIDFVKKRYPGIDIDVLLRYAGISKLQLNDMGYWCTQGQINKFNEILTKQTGNKNISRESGRHLMDSQSIIAQYIMGFISPTSVALQISSIYPKLSLGAMASAKKIGKNKFEFSVKTRPGVKEKLFQCRNRIGSLEGIYKVLIDEYPIIDHPECMHNGDKICRYRVSWGQTSQIFKWSRMRDHSIFLGIFIPVAAYFVLPFNYFLLIIILTISVQFILTYKLQSIEKNKLNENIKKLGKTAEELWEELNIRYNLTKLVQEVGEITSVIQNENEISTAVSGLMSKHLDYGRGSILLAKSDKKCLFFKEGYGFTEDENEILNRVQFSLENSNTDGILQKVFLKQEPILIEDISKITLSLNPDNLFLVKKLNIQSMICVPIVHEGESLGIIVVDSLKVQREFREGDINLLMAVASQTALSIANARSFQKLQESEKKHRTLVETIRDIVYTVDLEGRFTYLSPMVEVITGYKDNELIGRPFLNIINPADKDSVMRRFISGLESGRSSTHEIEILTKNNKAVPIELNVSSLTDTKGQIIGRIGVARDISRRKLEEAKRQDVELKALTQDKLASIGEIATGIAHEINQPLSFIKVILQSTLSDMETERLDREELAEDFDESLRQVGKISNITSHLRTFGRSDVTSFSPIKLSKVIDDTLILMNERLRIKNIRLKIQIRDKFPLLYGNHIKLEQVFVNLIQNSMDAMEEHGKGEIMLTAKLEDDEVLITYSDTGEGIKPHLQEKVFDPFFTTKEVGKGTGIGLSIVYGIIQEHNGAITCEPEEGQGAVFKIKLPVYEEEKAGPVSAALNA